MNTTTRTRMAAGLGAGAAAVAAMSLAAGAAHADPESTNWTDGNSRFTMTVSDSTPKVGDTITVASTFQRKWADEYIYQVKQVVPSCLEYVDGTATWAGGKANKVENGSGQTPGYAKITSPDSTSWRVVGLGADWGAARTVTMQFTVTAACATGETQGTTMHYGGSLGEGVYQDKGPTITVAKSSGGNGNGNGNGNGSGNGTGGAGSLDTGSLGSLFG